MKISLIIGKKGSGKTKKLIEGANNAATTSKGNVVCIEKGNTLNFDISSSVRLVNAEEYNISGADAYFGFLSGICACNYDVTDIYCDATLKIIGNDMNVVADFFKKVSALADNTDAKFTFTLSCDESDLPAEVFTYVGK